MFVFMNDKRLFVRERSIEGEHTVYTHLFLLRHTDYEQSVNNDLPTPVSQPYTDVIRDVCVVP